VRLREFGEKAKKEMLFMPNAEKAGKQGNILFNPDQGQTLNQLTDLSNKKPASMLANYINTLGAPYLSRAGVTGNSLYQNSGNQ
jgi:hypothetical protein